MSELKDPKDVKLRCSEQAFIINIKVVIEILQKDGKVASDFTITEVNSTTITLADALKLHGVWLTYINGDAEFRKNSNYEKLKFSRNNYSTNGNSLELVGVNLDGKDLRSADFEHVRLSESSLIGCDLSDANFENATLFRVKLNNANLEHTNFQRASLVLADLTGAKNLREAKLNSAKCRNAIFDKNANLSRVHWQGVELQEVNLEEADLEYAILDGANLENVNLTNVKNLNSAFLHNANLQGIKLKNNYNLSKAELIGANLQGVDLKGSDLRGAKLQTNQGQRRTDLRGVDLTGANLSDANLEGADLRGTILKGADLQNAIISEAIIDQTTLENATELENGAVAINNSIIAYADQKNGRIYHSVAHFQEVPQADSMIGQDAGVVVENLKHAQHLTGVYWLMSATILVNFLMPFFPNTEWKESLDELPILGALVGIPEYFLFGLSLLIPIVLLMIKQELEKAYEGAKHLQTREEIYKVGAFAWTLTQYFDPNKNNKSSINLYKFLRWIMIYCAPLSLTSIFIHILYENNLLGLALVSLPFIPYLFISMAVISKFIPILFILSIILGVFIQPTIYAFYFLIIFINFTASTWLFSIVEQFQKPLVFDAYKGSPENK